MFTRTGEVRSGPHERCVCSCGAESWVRLKRGELTAKSCHPCSARARMRSKPGDLNRECKICKKTKPVGEFCKDRNSRYLCLACKREQATRAYAADPRKVQDRVARKYVEQRAFMDGLKDGPCKDCGQKFEPCQMDFDHVSGDKVSDLARMFHWARGKILTEVAKCDLVCANCHRDRTQKRVESEYRRPGYGGEKPLKEAYKSKWVDVPFADREAGRVCSKCRVPKAEVNFAPRGDGKGTRTRTACRHCVGKAMHERARRNIDSVRAKRQERSDGMAKWFESTKDGKDCVDCGIPHPHWRLDYDHLDGKLYKPGRLKNSLHSRALVSAELAKCELVCVNHHRLRTWRRQRAAKAGPV